MSQQHPQPPSSSLMPRHSADLAADLSAHLSSALSDDRSYEAINAAKLRGVSNLVGWEQFHGMVLTAHLKPVNLQKEPIDELAKGPARTKKVEQAVAASMDAYARGEDTTSDGSSGLSAAQRAFNAAFLQSVDMAVPSSAHEWARDWKRLEARASTNVSAASSATSSSSAVPAAASAAPPPSSSASEEALEKEKASLRYKYMLSLPLGPQSQLFKQSLPLNLIPEIVTAVYTQWQQQTDAAADALGVVASLPAEPVAAADAVADDDAAAAASSSAAAAAVSPVDAASSSSSACDASSAAHVLLLLQRLSSTPSFSMALCSLKLADKQRLSDVLEQAREAITMRNATTTPNAAAAAEAEETNSLVQQLRTKFKLPTQ
jgi:hypothetical protein